jgi:hypothetical protein
MFIIISSSQESSLLSLDMLLLLQVLQMLPVLLLLLLLLNGGLLVMNVGFVLTSWTRLDGIAVSRVRDSMDVVAATAPFLGDKSGDGGSATNVLVGDSDVGDSYDAASPTACAPTTLIFLQTAARELCRCCVGWDNDDDGGEYTADCRRKP